MNAALRVFVALVAGIIGGVVVAVVGRPAMIAAAIRARYTIRKGRHP